MLKTNKVRADTTVVPANVAYPTDSGLLAKGVAKMAKALEKSEGAGFAPRTKTRDRTRMMRRPARSIGANLRRRTEEAKDEVMAINAEHGPHRSDGGRARPDRWRPTPAGALKRLGNAAPGRLDVVAGDLEVTAERVAHIAEPDRQAPGRRHARRGDQVWCRCTTPTPGRSARVGSANRSSSVTRPRSSTTRTASSSTTTSRSATHPMPPCSPRRSSASARRAKRVPDAVTADRGYGEAAVGEQLSALGVRTGRAPDQGQTERRPTSGREADRSSKSLVRWRTGSEGRISCLKRDFGWNRTRIDGLEGARTWCGHGVFNHNLVKIGVLTTSE